MEKTSLVNMFAVCEEQNHLLGQGVSFGERLGDELTKEGKYWNPQKSLGGVWYRN